MCVLRYTSGAGVCQTSDVSGSAAVVLLLVDDHDGCALSRFSHQQSSDWRLSKRWWELHYTPRRHLRALLFYTKARFHRGPSLPLWGEHPSISGFWLVSADPLQSWGHSAVSTAWGQKLNMLCVDGANFETGGWKSYIWNLGNYTWYVKLGGSLNLLLSFTFTEALYLINLTLLAVAIEQSRMERVTLLVGYRLTCTDVRDNVKSQSEWLKNKTHWGLFRYWKVKMSFKPSILSILHG